MVTSYPAYIYKEKGSGYSVVFPDLNHLATCGDTLDQALAMAQDCLAGYLHLAAHSGEVIPPPSDIKVRNNPDEEYDEYDEAFTNLIAVDVAEYAKAHFNKAVKKTLTIPAWLNDYATSKRVNFSAVLQRGLMQELHIDPPHSDQPRHPL